jgi:hypothetical protein
MINPGARRETPVTREAVVFHRTSAQTDGEEDFVEVTGAGPGGTGFPDDACQVGPLGQKTCASLR